MPLYLNDGKLLRNGSQLAAARSCCCDAPCVCNRTVTYSYYDSVPPGKYYTECPNIGKCDGSSTGDCAGDVLDGFIVERFKKSCITNITIRAYLKSGSVVDDYGIIGGVETSNICGSLGVISGDHNISDQIVIEDDGDYVKAKIPISITNSETLGGPHGLAAVTICWCCQSPTGSGCNECLPPPTPPPPCAGDCNNGSCSSKQQPCYCCGGGCQTTRCSCCLADLTGRTVAFEGKTFTWGTNNTIIEGNSIWEANFSFSPNGEFSRYDFLPEVPNCVTPFTIPTRGVYLYLSCLNGKWVADVFTYCAPRTVSSPCDVQQTAYQARAYFAEISCIADGANNSKPFDCLGNLQDQEGFPYNNDEFPGRCEAPYADFCIY